MNNTVQAGVIKVLDNNICELCGEVGELRPYGPNGENVCYSCGMKDEQAAKRAFDLIHDGKSN